VRMLRRRMAGRRRCEARGRCCALAGCRPGDHLPAAGGGAWRRAGLAAAAGRAVAPTAGLPPGHLRLVGRGALCPGIGSGWHRPAAGLSLDGRGLRILAWHRTELGARMILRVFIFLLAIGAAGGAAWLTLQAGTESRAATVEMR